MVDMLYFHQKENVDTQISNSLPSSGSTYVNSQTGTSSQSSLTSSETDMVENVSDDSFLLVSWSCLLLLFRKCHQENCSDDVLPENLSFSMVSALIHLLVGLCHGLVSADMYIVWISHW